MRNFFLIVFLFLSSSLYASSELQLADAQYAGNFTYYSDGSKSFPIRYIYPKDIDGDGVDEVFFAGFETQPNTPENYSNTSIFIYGWKNGIFQDITSQWLPGNLNIVEAVGDIDFGDFNDDGLLDVFLSAYADMDHLINAYALMNQGGSFTKVSLGKSEWEHGVFAEDINQDGYDDVFSSGYVHPVSIYMGGENGLTKVSLTGYDADNNAWYSDYNGHGSGVAVADFMNDGTQTVIITDANGGAPADTQLFKVIYNSGTPVALQHLSTLPTPLLTLPEWIDAGITDSHDVRAVPFDFSGDNVVDLLIFSRAWMDANFQWPNISTIQFLENKGGGIFEDVTSTRLVDYDNASSISYNPIIADFNNDGLMDIFSGEVSFESVHNSNTILVQEQDGKFVDTGRSVFNQIIGNNIYSAIGNLAKGPNNKYHFVWEEFSSSTGLSSVYSSEATLTGNNNINLPSLLYLLL